MLDDFNAHVSLVDYENYGVKSKCGEWTSTDRSIVFELIHGSRRTRFHQLIKKAVDSEAKIAYAWRRFRPLLLRHQSLENCSFLFLFCLLPALNCLWPVWPRHSSLLRSFIMPTILCPRIDLTFILLSFRGPVDGFDVFLILLLHFLPLFLGRSQYGLSGFH